MSVLHTEDKLARRLEVVSMFDIIILHSPGTLHNNADGLSQRRSNIDSCQYEEIWQDLDKLCCGGWRHCTKLHSGWSIFELHIDDDVTPLVIWYVVVSPGDDEGSSWVKIRSPKYLREEQYIIKWYWHPAGIHLVRGLEQKMSWITKEL